MSKRVSGEKKLDGQVGIGRCDKILRGDWLTMIKSCVVIGGQRMSAWWLGNDDDTSVQCIKHRALWEALDFLGKTGVV